MNARYEPGSMPMHGQMPAESSPWTRLWKTGVLHSCSTGIDGNYDREILEFWRQRFESLKDHDVLVDIGTGNGAIPLLAGSFARSRRLDLAIHGVDHADIDPQRYVSNGIDLHAGTVFHPNTSMTDLPFDDGSVSLVCSQFAFEYAPLLPAAKEILRVIGKHGRAAIVAHSSESVIASTTVLQLAACRWLLRSSQLLPAARDLLTIMTAAGSQHARQTLSKDPVAESARHAFNQAASELMSKIEETPDAPILQVTAGRISSLLQNTFPTPAMASESIARLQGWIEDEEIRLEMMRAAALDSAAVSEAASVLGATQLPVRVDRLLYRGSTCMGWTLVVGNE